MNIINYVMKSIQEYLIDNSIADTNEGLVRNAISLLPLSKMDGDYIMNGILNMYEYICDDEDIKNFYRDYPAKERPLWKNLYKMYSKGVWSIFDVNRFRGRNVNRRKPNNNNHNVNKAEENDMIGLEPNVLTKIDGTTRRNFRKLIQYSRNSKLDIKPGQIDSIMLVNDKQFEENYIFTINRTNGVLKRMFNAANIKLLEKIFSKIGESRDVDNSSDNNDNDNE